MATRGGSLKRMASKAKERDFIVSDDRVNLTQLSQDPAAETDRVDRVRRRMIKAAWVMPVVMAVTMPKDAFAQYEDPGPGPSE